MRLLFVIGLLISLSATAATPDNKPADCSSRQLASTELLVGEQILVPVEYHGQRLWMALDLGSPFSVLWPSAVETLHLRTEPLDDRDGFKVKIGGERVATSAAVDSLKIGGYRIGRRDFFVDPQAHPSASPAEQTVPAETERPARESPAGRDSLPDRPVVIGWLGMGELWPVDFELDLAHRRFSLYSPGSCAKGPVHWAQHYSQVPMVLNELGNVYFALELNGSKIEAGISTRNPETYMSTDVSRKVFGFDEHSPDVQVRADANGQPQAYFRAMTLTSGDLKLSDVMIRLGPAVRDCRLSSTGMFGQVAEFKGRDDYLCYGVYPLVLGTQAIEHLRLYFAPRQRTIYFTAAQ
jgi:hypothetical protein